MNYALIIAGGSGNRMGQDIPKQFMHVDNCPIIIHTMMAFQKHPDIQGTGCHRIGDTLLLSLFVGCYQIAQTEGLGCLGTDQFVARNTGVGRKTIFALQDSLSTFDTRNGIAILLADGDIG